MLEDAKRDVQTSDLALWTADQKWFDEMMYGAKADAKKSQELHATQW